MSIPSESTETSWPWLSHPPRRGSFTSRFFRTLRVLSAGIFANAKNPNLRGAYWVLLMGFFVGTLVLDAAGIWLALRWTDPSELASFWAKAGLWAARIVGIGVVLLLSPLTTLFLCNVLFPVFSEIPFFSGVRLQAPKRAAELKNCRGMGNLSAIFCSLRRLAYLLAVLGACFVLAFVPLVGPFLAPTIQFYVSARIVGWELLDPYFQRLGIAFSVQKQILRQWMPEVLALGMVSTPLLAIPFAGPLLFGLLQASVAQVVLTVFEDGREERERVD